MPVHKHHVPEKEIQQSRVALVASVCVGGFAHSMTLLLALGPVVGSNLLPKQQGAEASHGFLYQLESHAGSASRFSKCALFSTICVRTPGKNKRILPIFPFRKNLFLSCWGIISKQKLWQLRAALAWPSKPGMNLKPRNPNQTSKQSKDSHHIPPYQTRKFPPLIL